MNTTHHERSMEDLRKSGLHEQVVDFYMQSISRLGRSLDVLDLGAGSGLVSSSLAEKPDVRTIVAYDRNLDCMRSMKPHPKIAKCVEGQVSSLPFASNQFDVVVCRYAFHHFERKIETLREIARVLRGTGSFLYSDPVLPEHSRDVLNPLYYIREENFHGYLGYFETMELLESNGFHVLLSRPYMYPYSDIEQYLEGVKDGFFAAPPQEVVECIKSKLRHAWGHLDSKTEHEISIQKKSTTAGFSYHMVDLTCEKKETDAMK